MGKVQFDKWVVNRLASLVSWINSATLLVATNVQDALVELANRTFEVYFDAYYDEDESNNDTTSGGWNDVLDVDVTNRLGGEYLFIGSVEIRQSDKQKRAGTRFRIGGTTWIDSRDGLSTDNFFDTRAWIKSVSIPAGTTKVEIQHGQADDGGTIRTRRARFFMFRWKL